MRRDPLAAALVAAVVADPAALDALADAIGPRLADRLGGRPTDSGYLAPADAAAYLGIKRKRLYDLTSARVLVPDGRDGRTPLYLRSTLDEYARGA